MQSKTKPEMNSRQIKLEELGEAEEQLRTLEHKLNKWFQIMTVVDQIKLEVRTTDDAVQHYERVVVNADDEVEIAGIYLLARQSLEKQIERQRLKVAALLKDFEEMVKAPEAVTE